jgi:transcriptional regulator with XRE-family HTH domain
MKILNELKYKKKNKSEIEFSDVVCSVGNYIERMRIQDGMLQTDLAKKIHTSQSYISRIENGSVEPSLKTLFKLSKALETYLMVSFGRIMETELQEDDSFVYYIKSPYTEFIKGINNITPSSYKNSSSSGENSIYERNISSLSFKVA